MPETHCHGDVFHIQQQFEQVANGLARQAQGATTQRIKLEGKIAKARLTNSMTQKLTIQQVSANRREAGLVARAQDVKILCQWFSHDVLALAGPDLAVRQELFDFVEQELADIAQRFELPLRAVREVCLLHRKPETSNAYWERWNQLHAQLSGKFHGLMEAVGEVLKQTPRASSMVENLN